ncbi:MAG: DUF4914 family protein [Lachnospirales bacterium]
MDDLTKRFLNKIVLPPELKEVIDSGLVDVIIPNTRQELFDLALGGKDNMTYDISYDVEGMGEVKEASVVKCKNGIVANYVESYMRRRDPESMVIGDTLPTDKTTYEERFGESFDKTRKETFEWLKQQKTLIILPFLSGNGNIGLGYDSILVCPKNAAFFAGALADLQGFITRDNIPNFFKPKAAVYVAPPFRHTHFDGKQIVVHNRTFDMHEVFSYNLYPGPSAKKGIYGVLLSIGEQEKWITLHASTVKVITPYDLTLTIMHEGASGGGKSEMLEPIQRQKDGKLLLGSNFITGEEYYVDISDTVDLLPVTDDMAICHPSLQNDSNKLVVADAEDGWFLRVNHIEHYGVQPSVEFNSIHPKKPIIMLNIDAVPGSTALIWEPIMDEPNKPCPNPRFIMPREFFDDIVNTEVEVDIRSFGLRQPPCTKNAPQYGIAGMLHILPPALAWLWRLAAPRGFANPSIVDNGQMKSEGVGSYWPFATGKKVDQANLLLEQITRTPETKYVLVPNQYIGAYKVDFAGQWAAREYLSRRGGVNFRKEKLVEARCPILGYIPQSIKLDGSKVSMGFLHVNMQNDVGNDAYDAGANMLTEFFKKEISQYLTDDLSELGRKIIETCLNDGTVQDYYDLIPKI